MKDIVTYLLFSLFIFSCNSKVDTKKIAELEASIQELETKLAKREKEIIDLNKDKAFAVLGITSFMKASSLFDSPLKQFFETPEFWEDFQVSPPDFKKYMGDPCIRKCSDAYGKAINDCLRIVGDEEDRQQCEEMAKRGRSDCFSNCDD